jgi:Molybdenum cofactor biosynthesis enzyme
MASLGVAKVRLTGGEPFARKGCDELLHLLHSRFPSLDLRLTTNGTLLEPHIPLLRSVGVSAVNLSLDSFDRATFARVTGRDLLPDVLASLDGLLRAGIRVKINAVAMVLSAALLSFLVLHQVVGLREGTIAAALMTGLWVRFFSRWTSRLSPYFQGEKPSTPNKGAA